MRILHYYPKDDTMVNQYVTMLCEGMGLEVENHVATTSADARTLLHGSHYDLLHLHGCWRNSSRAVVNMALKQGLRLILTPHGELEPWVMKERKWKEKLPKSLLYQRDIVRKAYAVIIQGKMEQECMQQLGWNPRTVIVRNCVITHSTTKTNMARNTFSVYQKVMDSNPLQLMTDETKSALCSIVKAGITGDQRWLFSSLPLPTLSFSDWRQILCYAHQEQITDTIQRGIRVLELDTPDLDVGQAAYFLPDKYQQADTIQKAVGNQFVSEEKRLLSTFRYLRKLTATGQLAIKHLIELDRELRQHDYSETALAEVLRERNLYKPTARLMQLMQELTGLTEGFMPIPPLNDRTTRQIRRQIDNHLTI